MISAEYDRDKGTTVKTFGEPCDIILNGEKVTKVELHNSLFGDSYNYQVAFAGTSIESMEVKGGCTSLNDFAFYGCTKLKSVDLCNNGLLDIGVATFEYCSNLTDIKIGRGCRFLPGYGSSYSATAPTYAFSSCESLKNIVLEDGLTILQDCFGPLHRKSNTNGEALELESLTIPGSLQEILPNINYKKAFYGSEKDWYASGVGSVEDSNIYVDNKLWQAPTGAVVVPEGTAAIRNGKFSKDATSIKIPDSVTEIDSMALARTAWFNSQPDGLVYNENWLVGYKGESPLAGNIEIKEGTTRYANIFNANENIRSIKFPEGIKDIIDYSFSGCSRLKSVHIPNSVERIGSYAFSDCILNSVEIPNSVKRIEAFAFNTHKDSLKSITIRKKSPEAFEFTSEDIFNRTICNNAILLVPTGSREAYATNEFWGQFRIIAEINNNTIEGVCSESIKWELDTETKTLTLSGEGELHDAPWHNLAEHINNVVVDDKIEIPNKDYFFGTSWYNNQPEGLLYIGSSLMGFKGVDSTTTVIDIKDGTRFIADEAFKNNSIIKKVNSPNSLKRIGEKAFYKCSALTSIAIDDVEIIGENAFTTCSNLQGELNLKNLTSLGEAAFDNCKSLEKITSLGYITNIPNRSFHGATNLKECNIPNTVKVIDKEAFYKTSLKKIIIPNSVDTIGLSAFTGAALDTIIIASNEVAILNQAFRDCDSIKAVYILSDSVPVKGWTSITMRPFYTGRKANPRGTLYVPLGCKEKYPEDITMDFVEVVEMDMTELRNKTGIDAPVSTTIEKRIIASDGKLIVSNTKAGEVVSLYSVTGSLLINTIAEGNNTEINISGISGINIVRIGSKAYKVSL